MDGVLKGLSKLAALTAIVCGASPPAPKRRPRPCPRSDFAAAMLGEEFLHPFPGCPRIVPHIRLVHMLSHERVRSMLGCYVNKPRTSRWSEVFRACKNKHVGAIEIHDLRVVCTCRACWGHAVRQATTGELLWRNRNIQMELIVAIVGLACN
jgi:hypothetical protein